MTSRDLPPSLKSECNDEETLEDEVCIRPRAYEPYLSTLQALAFKLIYNKTEEVGSLERKLKKLNELVEIVALIISKTYVERGDSFVLADDKALELIRDLLLQHNPSVVARNKNKRIPKDLFL
jgi:hypothetical protein